MEYVIESSLGETCRVDGANWLAAMAKAAALLDFDPDALTEWKVTRDTSGVFNIVDGAGVRYSLKIREDAPKIELVGQEEIMELTQWEEPTAPFSAITTPKLDMPAKPSLRRASVDDVAEELFEATGNVAEGTTEEAAESAIAHAVAYASADWGNVIRGGPKDSELVFIAGNGELGTGLVGHTSAFDVGLAGRCHRAAAPILVGEPNDRRLGHLPPLARGDINSLLCVPMVADDGSMQGVLHLVNVENPLGEAQQQAVEGLARMLANRMSVGN